MESEIKIKPAIDVLRVAGEMSTSEFQRTLYAWFENHGLIGELRAHLRKQMIEVLRQTAMGRYDKSKPDASPKVQALNLVIAEFLFRQGCHYALSVLTTEAPMFGFATQFSPSWSFTDEQIQVILETLHLGQTMQVIFQLYQTRQDPLLLCIIKVLHANSLRHLAPKILTPTKSCANSNVVQKMANIAVQVDISVPVKTYSIGVQANSNKQESEKSGCRDSDVITSTYQNQIQMLQHYIGALLQENRSLRSIITRQRNKIHDLSQQALDITETFPGCNKSSPHLHTEEIELGRRREHIKNRSKAVLYASTTSDEWNDSTNDMLQETRLRLDGLERESTKVDHMYQKFCIKQEERSRKVNVVEIDKEIAVDKQSSIEGSLSENLSLSVSELSIPSSDIKL